MYAFMANALQAGSIVAVLAGALGWFMVLRREIFAGHTLSTMAFPGAAGALLTGVPLAAGYFAFTAVGALALGVRRPRAGAPAAGARIGTVQAVGLACGFVFLSLYGGVLSGYEPLLFGSFLGVTRAQVLTLAAVAAAALAALALIGRPLLFASLDADVARAHGVPVRALSTVFLLLLGLAVAETAQITGVLLVFALLVAPPAAARALTPRIGLGLALSVVGGLAVAWSGLWLAYVLDVPVGFCVTSVALALYLLARAARA